MIRRFAATLAVILAALAAGCDPGPAAAGLPIVARVTRVADGDTFDARTAAGLPLRVRVAEIDAPEYGAPFGNTATRALRQLVDGETVELEPFDVDPYGRLVARVRVDGRDVAATLVADGLAVVYRRHAVDAGLYALEAEARAGRRGLWQGRAIPRGAGRDPDRPPRPRREPPWPERCERAPADCGRVETCGEALFYLLRCGARSLDGDGDGIPCERVCR